MEPKVQGMNINENCYFKYSIGNQNASPGHRHLRMFQRFLKLFFMVGMGRIMGLLKVNYSFLVQRASYIKYDGSRIFLHTLETCH